jgi:hypothetical protein
MALLKSKLSGGVRWSGLPGAERRTTLIDGSLRPLRYMEMKGGARFRDTASGPADSPDRLNTYRLNVALAPWNGLKLTGGYQRNPDSDDGSIRQVDAKSIGLETEVGRLRLRSSYGTEEEYASDRNMNLLELGADWKFSNYTLLSAVYQTRATLSDTLLGSDSYRLTFSHRVGSAFDLSLSGVMNLKSQNRQINWTDAEMRAEAKVGLRF